MTDNPQTSSVTRFTADGPVNLGDLRLADGELPLTALDLAFARYLKSRSPALTRAMLGWRHLSATSLVAATPALTWRSWVPTAFRSSVGTRACKARCQTIWHPFRAACLGLLGMPARWCWTAHASICAATGKLSSPFAPPSWRA